MVMNFSDSHYRWVLDNKIIKGLQEKKEYDAGVLFGQSPLDCSHIREVLVKLGYDSNSGSVPSYRGVELIYYAKGVYDNECRVDARYNSH